MKEYKQHICSAKNVIDAIQVFNSEKWYLYEIYGPMSDDRFLIIFHRHIPIEPTYKGKKFSEMSETELKEMTQHI